MSHLSAKDELIIAIARRLFLGKFFPDKGWTINCAAATADVTCPLNDRVPAELNDYRDLP